MEFEKGGPAEADLVAGYPTLDPGEPEIASLNVIFLDDHVMVVEFLQDERKKLQ